MESEVPSRCRVHNVFYISSVEPYHSSGHGLHDKLISVIDSGYVDRLGITQELASDVVGNQVLEDFEVKEIMESHYNAEGNEVLYLVK